MKVAVICIDLGGISSHLRIREVIQAVRCTGWERGMAPAQGDRVVSSYVSERKIEKVQ